MPVGHFTISPLSTSGCSWNEQYYLICRNYIDAFWNSLWVNSGNAIQSQFLVTTTGSCSENSSLSINKKPSCCWDDRLMAPNQTSRFSLSWPWDDPLKHNRGQRSRCIFINWAMVNKFFYRHPGPRSNRWEDMRHFHFRVLEMTLSRSSKVKFVADSERPIMTSQ
jgi:hypothetical protein